LGELTEGYGVFCDATGGRKTQSSQKGGGEMGKGEENGSEARTFKVGRIHSWDFLIKYI